MVRRAVLAAALAAVGLLVVVTLLSSTSPHSASFLPLLEPGSGGDARETTGEAVHLSRLDGQAPTSALVHSPRGHAVIVLKVAEADLTKAAQATGHPTDRWAIDHPVEPGMKLLAYHGHSTLHGCTVRLLSEMGLSLRDGVPVLALWDVCHHGQWNALAMADPQDGTLAPRPLGVVPLRLAPGADPVLLAGATIEQRRPFDAADGSWRVA